MEGNQNGLCLNELVEKHLFTTSQNLVVSRHPRVAGIQLLSVLKIFLRAGSPLREDDGSFVKTFLRASAFLPSIQPDFHRGRAKSQSRVRDPAFWLRAEVRAQVWHHGRQNRQSSFLHFRF